VSEGLVTVTGASGFIGSHIVANLLSRGRAVRATVRDSSDPIRVDHLKALEVADGGSLEIVEMDLFDAASVNAAIAGCTDLIHTAAAVRISAKDPQRQIVDPSVVGTQNVIAAIDAGALSFTGGYNAPIKDIRDYYRVGTPDLGAYEAGASKYILTMADDIAEVDRDFSGDTTFVKFSQALKFTVTTGDIDGNVVSSNEPVTWNVFPNQKYARVNVETADENTEGGTASAEINVTSETRGKGFRFRVIADIGDAFLRSNIYVIEELVTGAPPPVANLTVDPSDWANTPNFT